MTIRKKLFSIVSTIMALTMLLSFVGVFAEEQNIDESIVALNEATGELNNIYNSILEQEAIQECYNIFVSDPEYKRHFNENAQEAIDNYRSVAVDFVDGISFPYWYYGGVYGADVPLIKQSTSYYCGPASALQTLYALGFQGNVSGSTDSSKQATIASKASTNSSGTIVANLTNAINYYTGSSPKYTYMKCTNIGKDTLGLRILQSLRADNPVIMHCVTDSLGYYSGHKTGLYIAIKAYNPTTQKLILSDCNNNSSYHGEFTVSLDEVYNSLQVKSGYSDRYIIYAS